MKKISVVTMAAAVVMGAAAPLTLNGLGQTTAAHAATKTTTYSYVSNTSNSISVTGMKKGSVVTLLNGKGQIIATQTVKNNGTLTFNLNSAQLQKVTAKDSIKVGNLYSINFNFVGFKATNTSATKPATPNKTKGTTTETTPKAPTYSYVTNSASSVTVTSMKKGTTVTLMNAKGQIITAQNVKNNGSVTFKLSGAQLKKITSKDVLTVGAGNYSYKINFNFVK